jgi:DNA-binding transcriptional ArsR family regulator
VGKEKPGHQVDAYEAVFTALAHPARRRILLTVYFKGGSMTAGEIANMFKHAWPTTTRHLQVLESAGLLKHERQGRQRRYQIDCHRLILARDWLAWFSRDPSGKTPGKTNER